MTSQRAAGVHGDRTGEHAIDHQGSAVHRGRIDGGVAVPHPRAARLDIECVEVHEMIVDGAAALKDEFIGRAGRVLPTASPISTDPVCKISVLVPVPINFTEFVPPLIVPAFLTVPEPAIVTLDAIVTAADRRPSGIRHVDRAGPDARLDARDRAAAHIVHGGVGGEDGWAVRARAFDRAGVGGDVDGIGTNGKGGKPEMGPPMRLSTITVLPQMAVLPSAWILPVLVMSAVPDAKMALPLARGLDQAGVDSDFESPPVDGGRPAVMTPVVMPSPMLFDGGGAMVTMAIRPACAITSVACWLRSSWPELSR